MADERVRTAVADVYGGWFSETASMDDLRAGYDACMPTPPDSVETWTAAFGGVSGLAGSPKNVTTAGMLLYLHGGGYRIGSSRSHADLAARLSSAAEVTFFLPDYRLAPEHPYPAALDDALSAYRGVVDQVGEKEPVYLAGDSAGGSLTLSLLLALSDAGDRLPDRVAVLSPKTDFTHTGHSFWARKELDPINSPEMSTENALAYVGDHDPSDPLISPLFGELTGLPPLLVTVGTSEILFDDSVRLVDRAVAAGVDARLSIHDGMVHVFQMLTATLPEAQPAIEEIGRFLRDGHDVDHAGR